MSAEILDAVSRAVWVAGCCDDATYDEAVAAAKRGSPADASALLFNQEVAKAAISAMQSEISAERDAAVARAERAEARVAELETEVERLRAALGAEQDSADEMADVLSACGDGLMFDVYRLQAALDHHDALREAAIRAIPMPTDAAVALGRMAALDRAQGMREAAEICRGLISAAGAAGLQERKDGMRDASDAILARAEAIEKEARNG